MAPEDTVNEYSDSTFELMESLLRKIKRLSCQAEDTEQRLKSLKGKKRTREVDNWLNEVNSIEKTVGDIKNRVDQSDLVTRIGLEERIKKLIAEVEELTMQKPCEGSLIEDVPVPVCTQQPLLMTVKMVGQNFQRNMDKIWELLNDEKVKIIGVYGMGGAGKTTLVT